LQAKNTGPQAGAQWDRGLTPLSPIRIGAITAAVVVLLTGVALTSRPRGAASLQAPPILPAIFINAATFVVVSLGFLTAVLLITVFSPRKRRKRRPDDPPEWEYEEPLPTSWIEKLVMAAMLLLLLAGCVAALVIWWKMPGAAVPAAQQLPPGLPRPLPASPLSTPPAPIYGAEWLPLAVGLAIIAVVTGATVLLRPRKRGTLEAREVVTTVNEAIGDAMDELDRDSDPRRAVIAAYARMERVLRDAGLPRRPFEAPFEYLGRVLRQARVSGTAVHRLTELFERAKFSHHVINVTMKAEAAEALHIVQAQLGEGKADARE